MPRELILILGGARSGKSAAAEALAGRRSGGAPVLFVATARPSDDEMRARIARHQGERPAHWHTIEAPLHPAEAIRASQATHATPVVLLDCITLLVANHLLDALPDVAGDTLPAADEARAQAIIDAAIADLLAAYRATDATMILVSNEVGMGLVPPYPLGRAYRDLLGRVNARLAAQADAVLLLIAGLPIEITQLAAAWRAAQGGTQTIAESD